MNGFTVPASHCHALAPGHEGRFTNSTGQGLWAVGVEELGGARFRLLNHTRVCSGPRAVLLDRQIPPTSTGSHALFAPTPTSWLSDDGQTVRIVIACGTLVPAGGVTRRFGLQPQQQRALQQQQQQRTLHHHAAERPADPPPPTPCLATPQTAVALPPGVAFHPPGRVPVLMPLALASAASAPHGAAPLHQPHQPSHLPHHPHLPHLHPPHAVPPHHPYPPHSSRPLHRASTLHAAPAAPSAEALAAGAGQPGNMALIRQSLYGFAPQMALPTTRPPYPPAATVAAPLAVLGAALPAAAPPTSMMAAPAAPLWVPQRAEATAGHPQSMPHPCMPVHLHGAAAAIPAAGAANGVRGGAGDGADGDARDGNGASEADGAGNGNGDGDGKGSGKGSGKGKGKGKGKGCGNSDCAGNGAGDGNGAGGGNGDAGDASIPTLSQAMTKASSASSLDGFIPVGRGLNSARIQREMARVAADSEAHQRLMSEVHDQLQMRNSPEFSSGVASLLGFRLRCDTGCDVAVGSRKSPRCT